MPKTHGSDFSGYFWLSYFPLRLFLFRAPWVVTADEGEGRRGANPRWKRVDPDSEPGHTRGAWALQVLPPGPAADSAQRALLPPVCPRRRQEKEKKKEREMERREGAGAGMQGAGWGWGVRRVRGVLCSAAVCELCESSLSSPRRSERPRVFAHPGPSLGRGWHPSSSALHFGGPVGSLLSLAWISPLPPPGAVRWLFLSTASTEMLSGGILGRRLQVWCLIAALPEAVPF